MSGDSAGNPQSSSVTGESRLDDLAGKLNSLRTPSTWIDEATRIDPGSDDGGSTSPPTHLIPTRKSADSSLDDNAGKSDGPLRQDELLLQASQIAEHLRSQLAELNRREKTLNEQLALLDQERRDIRLSVQELEDDLRTRQQRLKSRDAELSQKITKCESLISDLETQQQTLESERTALAEERTHLQENVQREVDEQRQQLEAERQQFVLERDAFERERSRQQQSLQQQSEELQQQIATDRSRLKEQVFEELAAERATLDRDKAAWLAQKSEEASALQHEREALDEAVRCSKEEIDRLHAEQVAASESLRREQQERLQSERTAQQRELREQQEQWEKEKLAEQQELKRRQADFEQQRETHTREIEEQRATIAQQNEQDDAEHRSRIEADRAAFTAEIEQLRRSFEQKKHLFENRLRFQQEHLESLRAELDRTQREFRTEQQQTRAEIAERDTLLELRANQLNHVRDLLTLREESCERESEIVRLERQKIDNERLTIHQQVGTEQETWNRERLDQQTELQRQHDLLAVHAANLESRRARLDQLRSELESTHQSTLEMRMAVEEVYAECVQAVGDDESAKQRVEQARELIAAHNRQVRETLDQQRDAVAKSRQELQAYHEELKEERRRLTAWHHAKDEDLQQRQQQIRQQAAGVDADWKELAVVQARQVDERVETEHVIRDLLRQISELSDAVSG